MTSENANAKAAEEGKQGVVQARAILVDGVGIELCETRAWS